MSLPSISAICCTYGRTEHLNSAIAAFLAQDYMGSRKLIVLNTCIQQTLRGDFPNVEIINCAVRPLSLGAARNVAVKAAGDGICVVWDDDDAYLPHYLSIFAKHFTDDRDWVWLSRQFYSEQGKIKGIVQGTCNVLAFRKEAWEAVGGYPALTVGEDREFVSKLTSTRLGVKAAVPDADLAFIYSWGNGVYHASGLGDDATGKATAHDRVDTDLTERIRKGQEPTGDILLKPKLRHDWRVIVDEFLGRTPTVNTGFDETCLLELGRFGDCINALPIARNILLKTGRKPYWMISKEFSPLLDGISYVVPYPVDFTFHQLDAALEHAQNTFKHVVNCQIYGSRKPQERLTSSWAQESWRQAGCLEHFHSPEWKPVFDRRDATREDALRRKLFRTSKPKIITNFTSAMSVPFPNGNNILIAVLREFGQTHEIHDIGKLRVERIYDLLGLYEHAAVIVSIDTATMHLAAAVDVPLVALVNPEPWLGPVLRFNCAARIPYPQATAKAVCDAIRSAPGWFREAGKQNTLTIRRSGALGDILAATCISTALFHQGVRKTVFQCDPAAHPILRRHPHIQTVSGISGPPDVDLDNAYEKDPQRKTKHFAQMFIETANRQISKRGLTIPKVINFAPRIFSDPAVANQVLPSMHSYPKPWVCICPASQSWVNRTVPNDIWQKAAEQINGTKFWLGLHAAPQGIVDLQCRDVDLLIEYIGLCDILATVDTGPMHIAAAIGTPLVVIHQASSPELHLSDQRDWIMVQPDLGCLNCQLPTCPIDAVKPPCQRIDPVVISDAVNARLRSIQTNDTTAVIAVYKPVVATLNRCLGCVLPQVQEIVIVGDLDTDWPIRGIAQNPKVRFVRMQARKTGYGRKLNRGIRESNGKYILALNDDVFLEPDVVARLLAIMGEDDKVGVVTHELRYPNGTIQFAGVGRPRGHIGFGHIDIHRTVGRFSEPVEQESICGASVLIRRKAFYEVSGMDESFYLYSEDADFGLSIRKAGYRIIYEPRARGIHLEHQSTSLSGDIPSLVSSGQRIFNEKWQAYFVANPDVTKLGTFDYLK